MSAARPRSVVGCAGTTEQEEVAQDEPGLQRYGMHFRVAWDVLSRWR